MLAMPLEGQKTSNGVYPFDSAKLCLFYIPQNGFLLQAFFPKFVQPSGKVRSSIKI
jgi:hypothetical protein